MMPVLVRFYYFPWVLFVFIRANSWQTLLLRDLALICEISGNFDFPLRPEFTLSAANGR
jgi:hypothetical protein